jgi:hypothetical protein
MCSFLGGVLLYAWLKTGLPRQQIILRGPQGKEIQIMVDVAAKQSVQERGLMFRRAVTRGMLFVFEQPQQLSFWMKNTLVPLDVLFFTADGSFLSAEQMVPCRTDPCISYLSRGAAKYALEEAGGFVEREGIGVGWKLIAGKEY